MNRTVTHAITRYRTAEAAAKIAEANAADDDWTYTVTPSGDAFVIVIRDEDGHQMGCL